MRPSKTRGGLTIIEALVVIFVVAILLGLLIPGSRVGSAALKAQAMNDLTQICTATRAFYTDYGHYPIDQKVRWNGNAVYGFPGQSRHNSDVINSLRADGTDPGPNFHNAINTNSTIYLDVPYVRNLANPRSALGTGKETNRFGATVPGEFYDPWGTPFIILIDAHGGGCDLNLIYSGYPTSVHPRTDVTGISLGADAKIGINGNRIYAGSDDVICN
jgi:type II secretory pathway pseudopilin PulG